MEKIELLYPLNLWELHISGILKMVLKKSINAIM